ncbi:MAG: hypothetical protein C0445_06555 [Polaromonas sp.]|nr:hypothetical protein [Polaromonas sp.]
MLTDIETGLALLTLTVALWLRPWRMLTGALLSPFLAAVVLLPWFWMLPQMLPRSVVAGGISVQLSGACLLTLVLGWPLAVLALTVVAGVVWVAGDRSMAAWLSQWVWLGLVPATLTLALGAVIRRWLPSQVFIYILGRGFLGAALCIFVSGMMYELLYHLVGGVEVEQALVARWLMAWGDAFLTGMFVAIFVAFKPEWLATWSDRRYLVPPPAPGAPPGGGDDSSHPPN